MKVNARARIVFSMHVKQMFLRWFAIYLTITFVLWWLGPNLFERLPTYIFALIVTLIVVPAVHYVVLPMMSRITHPWVEVPKLKGVVLHKAAFIFWCSSYPVITVLLYVIPRSLQRQLPLSALTFFITIIAVPVISYLVLPRIQRIVGQ